MVPPKRVCRGSFAEGNVAWFDDGLMNVSVNCLDRHPPQNTAIIWEGDEVWASPSPAALSAPPRRERVRARHPSLPRPCTRHSRAPAAQVGDCRRISYGEALAATCQMANALKTLGVRKGDRVCLYMPMVPEAVRAKTKEKTPPSPTCPWSLRRCGPDKRKLP